MNHPHHSAPTSAYGIARQTAGLHLIGDLHGCRCDPRLMLDATHLQDFCQDRVAAAGLTAVGSLFHRFGEGGESVKMPFFLISCGCTIVQIETCSIFYGSLFS